MKVHETRSHAHAPNDEERMVTRKQKADSKQLAQDESEHSPTKKAKTKDGGDEKKVKAEEEDGKADGKSTADIAAEFEEFCRATSEHLSVQQMREILQDNGQDSSGSDDAVVPRWLVNPFRSE